MTNVSQSVVLVIVVLAPILRNFFTVTKILNLITWFPKMLQTDYSNWSVQKTVVEISLYGRWILPYYNICIKYTEKTIQTGYDQKL